MFVVGLKTFVYLRVSCKQMKLVIVLIFLSFFIFGNAQSKSEIELLLNEISEISNSKDIRSTVQAKKIKSYGEKVLPLLSASFTDKTETKIYSDCNKIKLNKGDLAIILSDYVINMLPYYQLTEMQNCTLTYCDDNQNLIEYYIPAIKNNGYESFQNKFNNWLNTEDYKKWLEFSMKVKFKKQKKNK